MKDQKVICEGCGTSFALGLAAHSLYLHEKKRHGWKSPWDHIEEEEKED